MNTENSVMQKYHHISNTLKIKTRNLRIEKNYQFFYDLLITKLRQDKSTKE